MKLPRTTTLFIAPSLSLSYILALSSAAAAFTITSKDLLFSTCIVGLAVLNNCFSPAASRTLVIAARSISIGITYLFALLPLWPGLPTTYYGTPAIACIIVALLAALNRESNGGSRGLISTATVAFLLLLRNIVLDHDFEAPIADLSFAISFIALIEISFSSRYRENNDDPRPEFLFGLLIALIASFHFQSMLLGVALAVLPLVAFLLSCNLKAETAHEHTQPGLPIAQLPEPPPFTLRFAFLALAVLSSILYLLILRLPSWNQFVDKDAPYLAKSLAQKVEWMASSSDLENKSLETFASKVIDTDFIKKKANQIARKLEKVNRNASTPRTTQSDNSSPTIRQDSAPTLSRRPSFDFTEKDSDLGPVSRTKTINTTPTGQGGPLLSSVLEKAASTQANLTPPPRIDLNPGIPDQVAPGPASNAQGPERENLEPFERTQPKATPADLEASRKTTTLDRVLDSFGSPVSTLAEMLNLEGNDVSALVNPKPLAVANLETTSAAPERLYLRTKVLDTVSSNGVGSYLDERDRLILSTGNNEHVETSQFEQSSHSDSTLTITYDPSRQASLPLPESFKRIQIFGIPELYIYPLERVVLLPPSNSPVTYRLFEADLDVTKSESIRSNLDDAYLKRVLEIPLDRADRSYLQKLAKKIGGEKSTTQRFASRFSDYFAKEHPYSYFSNTPPGSAHPVVRWLENQSPGICSNYAASFTLLARSRGIPARVVGGFATEEFDQQAGLYVIRQRNAHAWVEYLDESNRWIRFDPTPRISAAEALRAERFIQEAEPESLATLIDAEEIALQKPKFDDLANAATAISSTETSSKILDSTLPKRQVTLPPTTSEIVSSNPEEQPSTNPEPTQKTSIRPDTDVPFPYKPNLDPDAEELATYTNADSPATPHALPPTPSRRRLILLSVLVLIVPLILFTIRTQKMNTISQQPQLRQRAGRLLRQLELLIEQRHLESDPIWGDIQQTLAAQRYGREANAALVEDLAIKVALLANGKKRKRYPEEKSTKPLTLSQKNEYRN